MRTLAVMMGGALLVGCSNQQPTPPEPVRDSFYDFVAAAQGRAKEAEGSSGRIRFGSGRGYSAATDQTPAIGSVSLHVEAATEVRRILDLAPAMSISDYDLQFVQKDGQWEFKEGTVQHKLTEAYVTSGRTPNEIEPERTDAIHSLSDYPTLDFLFYGKKP